MTVLEGYFAPFREKIIGLEQTFESPFGTQKIIYADWTASGRAYAPIETYLQQEILPFAANTHTSSTFTGTLISQAYAAAKDTLKRHVNAASDDVLLFCGSGMTAAVNKLQRLLGMKAPVAEALLRPVVFITHMEHHSNQVSWLETNATVEIIGCKNGNVDLDNFKRLLGKYRDRPKKIAAITACSNVTGIETQYHEIAKIIHGHGGLCFVDFACSAPYVAMNMHPREKGAYLDAVYFSPHKFLGGPGTPGVLIFNSKLYTNRVPDQPGGGTINYSNPWGGHHYIDAIEQREDGGTPPYLQAIKAAQCIQLKEVMGLDHIHRREKELRDQLLTGLAKIKRVKILEEKVKQRLCIVSFIISEVPYHLIVRLLNDRFGIQARGGCSCAGTYGHYLLKVDEVRSQQILTSILSGNLQEKPGWVRLSLHPTTSDAEVALIIDAVKQVAINHAAWRTDYTYDVLTNEFNHGK